MFKILLDNQDPYPQHRSSVIICNILIYSNIIELYLISHNTYQFVMMSS